MVIVYPLKLNGPCLPLDLNGACLPLKVKWSFHHVIFVRNSTRKFLFIIFCLPTEAPKLIMKEEFSCVHNISSAITLTCAVSGEWTDFEFLAWKQFLNGKYVRSLDGTVEGRNVLLVIRTCSYQDAGEYVCNVAHNYTNGVRLMSKTSKLFVEDK